MSDTVGLVGLLLIDLVDSTRLVASLGDARAAEVLAAHDRLARDLLPAHDGREIDKTDGFLLLFEDATDALGFALAYHPAVADLARRLDVPLAARAGLHVGPVVITPNRPEDVARGAKPIEVEGLAKPMAARVMSLAREGQTLATTEAVEALAGNVRRATVEPDGRIRSGTDGPIAVSHGHWQLKGLPHPVELFELGRVGDAPFTPPPDGPKAWRLIWQNEAWLPVREIPHALPAERDPFVGREADLQELARRLDGGARLVTVLGIGGSGKTRLVTRFAWTWLGDFPGGAWFCDLSEARSAEGIAHAVAHTLEVVLDGSDAVTRLGHAIAGRGRCLVVLDNFEQVARDAPDTLGRWLDRARAATFVVTSREVLGLPGETSIALAPMPRSDARDLFLVRASQAKRDFRPSADDLEAVDALVKLLDGLPLAIELAAARIRLMPPRTLLARMGERFRLLASSGGRHTRQATLRATLDWSWELLSRDEQRALAQLSVFEGGFTLEAAETVLALEEAWPVDAVQGLVDKSLVREVTDVRRGSEATFDLLVTVQEYAAEKLDLLGERTDAEARHGEAFARMGTDEAIESLYVHGGVPRRFALIADLDNMLVACRRAVSCGDADVAVATLRAAWAALEVRGPFDVVSALAVDVLAIPALSPRHRGQVAMVLGLALRMGGKGAQAAASLEEAARCAAEVGDRRAAGAALGYSAIVRFQQGLSAEARSGYEEALRIARETGDRRHEGIWIGTLGIVDQHDGQMAMARARFERALQLAVETGDRRHEGVWTANLGLLSREEGDLVEARARYEVALTIAREVGNRRSEANCLGYLATVDKMSGRIDSSLAKYLAALALAREVGERFVERCWLTNVGLHHLDNGLWDAAREHLEAALGLARDIGDRDAEHNQLAHLAELALAEGRPEEAREALDAAEPYIRRTGSPMEVALLACLRARLESDGGALDAAEIALAEAEALALEMAARPASELGREIVRARDHLSRGRAPS